MLFFISNQFHHRIEHNRQFNYLVIAGEVSGQEWMHFHVNLGPGYDEAPGLANRTGRDTTDLDAGWQQLTE